MQVLELEKKIVKQRDTTWRVLEAKSHKHLQKKIELLEMHLSHVRKHFGDFWRTCVGSHRAWDLFGQDKAQWCKCVWLTQAAQSTWLVPLA